MEKLKYVWKGSREGNFKHLRIEQPHNFPNLPEYSIVVQKLTHIRKQYNYFNDYAWGSNYFEVVSDHPDCLKSFVNLVLEIYSYCRIYSTNVFTMPKGVIQDLKNIRTTNFGFLPQKERVETGRIIFSVAPGSVAVQESIEKKIVELHPSFEKSRVREPAIIWGLDRTFVSFALWNLLSVPARQNDILLASPLTIPIAATVGSRMQELIFEISRDPKVLRELGSRKVEELVAGLIEDKGYEVQLTARTRDGGRDIIALKGKGELLADEKYLIEVKHPEPEHPVSVGTVRELVGVGTVEPSTGLVLVSTTRFTRDAVELAAREVLRYRLSLKDYKDLMDWVEEYCKRRG